jgi:hypothetical protein
MAQFIRVKNLPMQQVKNPRIFLTEFASHGKSCLSTVWLNKLLFWAYSDSSLLSGVQYVLFRCEQLEDPYLLMENEVLFEHMKQMYLLSWHAHLSLSTHKRAKTNERRTRVGNLQQHQHISYPPERRSQTRERTPGKILSCQADGIAIDVYCSFSPESIQTVKEAHTAPPPPPCVLTWLEDLIWLTMSGEVQNVHNRSWQ